MKVVILLAAFVAAAFAQDSAQVYDENPLIVDMGVQITKVQESLTGLPCACCPKIVKPYIDAPANKSTVINPVTGWRGNAAVIVDYGTCSVTRTGYFWAVFWGDGSAPDTGSYDHLLQVQALHQYVHANRCYRITVHYCSKQNGYIGCCDHYSRVINTSYEPYPPMAKIDL